MLQLDTIQPETTVDKGRPLTLLTPLNSEEDDDVVDAYFNDFGSEDTLSFPPTDF